MPSSQVDDAKMQSLLCWSSYSLLLLLHVINTEKQRGAFEESNSISAALKPLQGQEEETSSLVVSVLALGASCTDSFQSHC